MRYLILAALLLTGCGGKILMVQTDYLSHENLASFHVGTPDPRLRNPPLGQRLIVNWSIPHWNQLTPYTLTVKIRFKNGTSTEENLEIHKSKGTYVFSLLNEEYFAREGFKTYIATIKSDGAVLEEWRHQLWANLIEITEDEGEEGYDNESEEEIEDTDKENYDEHFKGEGGLQRQIDDITDPNQTEYKYYF